MTLDMSKKWSERTREERDRILYAPFPTVRYIGRHGHAGAALPDLREFETRVWRDVECAPEDWAEYRFMTVRHMLHPDTLREW